MRYNIGPSKVAIYLSYFYGITRYFFITIMRFDAVTCGRNIALSQFSFYLTAYTLIISDNKSK